MNTIQESRTVKVSRETSTRVAPMTTKTRGQRFFLVRLACGDGVRTPEPMHRFVERVLRDGGVAIHVSVLSDMENDKPAKTITLDHVAGVAAVDPQRRGKLWLAWGEREDPTMALEDDEHLAARTGLQWLEPGPVEITDAKEKPAAKRTAGGGRGRRK